MNDEYISNWIKKADNDLKVAENELHLDSSGIVTDAICFHSQQAVEKYLKVFLISKEIEFGKTHNLEYLLELCIKIDNEFESMDVGNLSFYAVELRYPDNFYTPSIEEAEESYNIASRVKEFVLAKLLK